jgi:hypothetical protein
VNSSITPLATPEDPEQQGERDDREQHMPDRVQADDQREHPKHAEHDPGTGGLLRGRERRDQPVDARHDQLDADDRRGEQRDAGPDQGADPGRDREHAECQHPAPMLPDPPDRLGRARLR